MMELMLANKKTASINTDIATLSNFNGLIAVDVDGVQALRQERWQTQATAKSDFVNTFDVVGTGDFEFSFNIYVPAFPSDYMSIFFFDYPGGNFAARLSDGGFGHLLQFSEINFGSYAPIINTNIHKNDFVGRWRNVRFVRENGLIYLYIDGTSYAVRRDGVGGSVTGTSVVSNHNVGKFTSLRLGTSNETQVMPVFTDIRFSFVNGFKPVS